MTRINPKFLCILLISVIFALFSVNSYAQDKSTSEELDYLNPQNLEDLRKIESRVTEIIERVRPAVVGIRIGQGSGSGTILSEDGWVMTAAHVIRWQSEVKCSVILHDGTVLQAVSKGYNRTLDFALLKAEVPENVKLTTVKAGDSDDVKVGRWIISMGHPLGFFTNPTRPPVVRVGRVVMRHRMIVSDAPLISGDSGGPMFNLDGEIVGVNVSIGITDPTINNTTCINAAIQQLDAMKEGKAISDSGVSVSGYDRAIEEAYKVLDEAVKDKKPESFQKAVEAFENVIKMDENYPDGYYHLACAYTRWMNILKDDERELKKQKALEKLKIAFEKGWRNFQHMQRDPDMNNIRETDEYKNLISEYQREGAYFGVSVGNLTDEEKSALDIKSGIKILEVVAKSPADTAGLKPDDIILSIDDKEIADMIQLRNLMPRLKPQQKVKVKILRQKEEIGIEVTLGGVASPAQPATQTSNLNRLLYKEGATNRNLLKEITTENNIYHSVVRITGAKKLLGYGVIVKEDGYIIAKYSQCISKKENYPEIEVELHDGRKFAPALVNESSRYDLALLKIDATELKPVEWGSSEDYRIGEFVANIGTSEVPFALGVVSLFKYESNIGAKRPGLGIQAQDVSGLKAQGLSIDKGVLVSDVIAGSGAAAAQLRKGDIIFDVDDEPIESLEQLRNLLNNREVGDKIWVSVYRNGVKMTIVVTLSELQSRAEPASNPFMNRIFGPRNQNSQGYGEVIQHDSVLNPDSTGSLLMNLKGEIIGMNISRVERTRSYALPADVLKEVISVLIENKRDVLPKDTEIKPEDEPIEEDF